MYGVGQNDSELHSLPADEFRIVSPLRPPEGIWGVWAEARHNSDQWAFPITIRGISSAGINPIPDGTYTIDYEVESDGVCSSGGVITGSLTVRTENSLPQVHLFWDGDWSPEGPRRGGGPSGSVIAPGTALRDATGAVAVYRAVATNDLTYDYAFKGPYTDVPVRIFVDRHNDHSLR